MSDIHLQHLCAKPDWAHGETIGRSSSKDRAEQLRFLWRRSLALEEANTCDKRRELASKNAPRVHGSKFQTKHLRGFSLHTKRLLQKVQSSARQRSLIWILLGAQHLDLLAFILWAYVTYVPWYRLFTWRESPTTCVTCGCERDWVQTIQAVQTDLRLFPHQETRENRSGKGIEMYRVFNTFSFDRKTSHESKLMWTRTIAF